jgi:cyclopropane-fatty-acyl-phospholipid synthase
MIDALLTRNVIPDTWIRFGIRRLLRDRLREEQSRVRAGVTLEAYSRDLRTREIAEQTRAANEQHYEVPAEFFQLCLGKRLKYSCCFFPNGDETLDQAEEEMLALYVDRAELRDGQEILDLGCGWGSLTLYLAERFPKARLTCVSNSHSQRAHIESEAARRGLRNVSAITCDMNAFEPPADAFDRVVSVEMFEHMKNYARLLAKVRRGLRRGGKLFVHIFTHEQFAYHFEARGPSDWMARHFFTGGQMPAHNLLARFQDDLRLGQEWKVNGRHYQRTAELWLENMDRHEPRIREIFREVYGADQVNRWWAYWRVFYMSCAELWGYADGREWIVSHYLFENP